MPDQDDNSSRGNFTQIPNLLDELGLSPLAIALYFHYKRWANAKDKKWLSVSELKRKFRTGSDSIRMAKEELIKNDLIAIHTAANIGRPDQVEIKDVWKRNDNYFKKLTPIPEPVKVQVRPTQPIQVQASTDTGSDLDPDRFTSKEERKEKKERERDRPIAADFEEPRNRPPNNSLLDHPGIKAIRNLTKSNPPLEVCAVLSESVGQEVDEAKLAECYTAWRLKGFKDKNYGWVTDWYRNGIPLQHQLPNLNGNGHATKTAWQTAIDGCTKCDGRGYVSTETGTEVCDHK